VEGRNLEGQNKLEDVMNHRKLRKGETGSHTGPVERFLFNVISVRVPQETEVLIIYL
jgi:hypothetical protein